MIRTDIMIIGGGASGIFAALIAHDLGANVCLIEGQNRLAKKLLATGNGRCNISNQKIKMPFVNYHSNNKSFYQKVLNKFTVKDTVAQFNYYGLPITSLADGRMYPESLQASSVIDLLLLNLEERKIPIYLESKVTKINKLNDEFIVEVNNDNNNLFSARKLLIACGGMASPHTGSDGSIYDILRSLGHKINQPLPTIVQLKLTYNYLKSISGVRFDALAKVCVDGIIKRQDYDEVLFTDYGISGKAILQLSHEASIALHKKQDVKIRIDLFPHLSEEELKNILDTRYELFSHRSIYQVLIGFIHKKLIPVILKDSEIIDIHKTCYSLTYQEKLRLKQNLKNWTFTCIDTNGFKNAQGTIGGVDTGNINSETLESKIVKDLYFAGEVIDVVGDCGGFNLQWAWSSGYIAGSNLVK